MISKKKIEHKGIALEILSKLKKENTTLKILLGISIICNLLIVLILK